MTDPYAAPPAAPSVPKVSFFEDVIDIFFQPAGVFRRRENSSAWPPMLFVAILIGLITFATFNTIEPIFAAEFQRNAAKAMAKNPAVTAEMMNKALGYTEAAVKYGAAPGTLIAMFLIGTIGWLLGKLFASKQTYGAALVVAGWAYMPRVIGSVIGAVQGLIMDPSKLNSAMAITLSPARFMDPDSANPLLIQFAGRFDLITIWVTILLGIGFYITGKVSKERAILYAILIWFVGGLQAFRTGYTMM